MTDARGPVGTGTGRGTGRPQRRGVTIAERRRLRRVPVVVVSALCLSAGLYVARGPVRVVLMVVLGGTIAALVVVVPAKWRSRAGVPSAAFLAVLGVLPVVVDLSGDGGGSGVNVAYLADLAERGPFTEPLPAPLRRAGTGVKPVQINSLPPSVLTALALDTEGGDTPRIGCFAFFEVYPNLDGPLSRKEAEYMELWANQVDRGTAVAGRPPLAGDAKFTVSVPQGGGDIPRALTVGGNRGYVYAEASCSDYPSNQRKPGQLVDAMLDYGDRVTKLATED